jgi:transcriptional regulator with XRE-family HTH domain
LAFHSGVSSAAIAQIETGRRKDVRPGTLSALAVALGVSVDYLIGSPSTISSTLLHHRIWLYSSDEEFDSWAVDFLDLDGEASTARLVVTKPASIERLRRAIGDRAPVEFVDEAEVYHSPKTAIEFYRGFVTSRFEAGAPWMRVIGDPVWDGIEAEISWTRYESMVNLAFASSPVTLACVYDTRVVPASIVEAAHRTHPEVVSEGSTSPSSMYELPEDFLFAL